MTSGNPEGDSGHPIEKSAFYVQTVKNELRRNRLSLTDLNGASFCPQEKLYMTLGDPQGDTGHSTEISVFHAQTVKNKLQHNQEIATGLNRSSFKPEKSPL